MTREETQMILAVIDVTYPNFKIENKTATVDAWYYMLSEYDYNAINIALKAYVTTSGTSFAPSVSQLIAMAHKKDEYSEMNEMEAWDIVNKAIRRSSYYAQEEYDKLPEIIQRCVGSPSQLRSWSQTSEDTIDTVVASNFQRTYRGMINRQREYTRLPMEAKALIGGNDEKLRIQESQF